MLWIIFYLILWLFIRSPYSFTSLALSFARTLVYFCGANFILEYFFFCSFHHKFIVESLFLEKFFNVFFLFQIIASFLFGIFFSSLLSFGLNSVCRHRHFPLLLLLLSFISFLNVSLEFSDLTLSRPIIWFYFIRTHYYCCESVGVSVCLCFVDEFILSYEVWWGVFSLKILSLSLSLSFSVCQLTTNRAIFTTKKRKRKTNIFKEKTPIFFSFFSRRTQKNAQNEKKRVSH